MFVSVTVGAVYHQFKRAVHVDPSIVADPSLPFLVTFDFNRSPFCVEIGQAQISPMGRERLVMIDEVIGQEHLTGPEGAIGRMVSAGRLSKRNSPRANMPARASLSAAAWATAGAIFIIKRGSNGLGIRYSGPKASGSPT